MIREADSAPKRRWLERFVNLPPEAREALRRALLDLRADSAARAEYAWRKRKAPMALYHRVVSVYAGTSRGCFGLAEERDGRAGRDPTDKREGRARERRASGVRAALRMMLVEIHTGERRPWGGNAAGGVGEEPTRAGRTVSRRRRSPHLGGDAPAGTG